MRIALAQAAFSGGLGANPRLTGRTQASLTCRSTAKIAAWDLHWRNPWGVRQGGATMILHTKFWFRADAVVSAQSKHDAWRQIAQIATQEAEGSQPAGAFLAGEMSMQQNGTHWVGPTSMTGPAEDALVALYHKKVIEQGE